MLQKENLDDTFKSYQAGIYTRLSQDRKEEYRDKSNSLVQQEEICLKAAYEKGIKVIRIYQDYEYSGTNFERPGFNEMMQDIRERKINCVIVKDLSRFGRAYLEIGNYIEKVFPFLGIRFISVNDNYDTENGRDDKKSFEVAIKNIINDMYVKDISKKVSATKQEKMKSGYFVGPIPPYGYRKMKYDKGNKLVIDENVREVVQMIFELAYKGHSQVQIARVLTDKYTTPLTYMKTGKVIRDESDHIQWDNASIAQILRNEAYIGNLVQGTYVKKADRKVRGYHKNKLEWIKVENTHEGIIDKQIFWEVQQKRKNRSDILQTRNRLYSKDNNRPTNKYDGILKCKHCGRSLSYRYKPNHRKDNISPNKKQYFYFCRGEDNLFLNEIHSSIWSYQLDKILQNAIKDVLSKYSDERLVKDKIQHYYVTSIESTNKHLLYLENKVQGLEMELQKLYESYVKGILTLDCYQKDKGETVKKIESFREESNVCNNKKAVLKDRKTKLEKFVAKLFKASTTHYMDLDSTMIHLLIDFIEVGSNKDVSIHFRFDIEEEIDRINGGSHHE